MTDPTTLERLTDTLNAILQTEMTLTDVTVELAALKVKYSRSPAPPKKGTPK